MHQLVNRPAYRDDPDFAVAMSSLQRGSLDSAMEASERLCQSFPGEPAVLGIKASVLMESGEFDGARKLWGLVVDLASDQVDEIEREFDGEDVTRDDVVQKCAEFNAQRLSLLSLSDRARFQAAVCCDRAGDRPTCTLELERAVHEHPESVFLHAMLGILYKDEERQDDAESVCRTALRLPEHAAFSSDWRTLAEVCETVGMTSASLAILRRHGTGEPS